MSSRWNRQRLDGGEADRDSQKSLWNMYNYMRLTNFLRSELTAFHRSIAKLILFDIRIGSGKGALYLQFMMTIIISLINRLRDPYLACVMFTCAKLALGQRSRLQISGPSPPI